MMTRILLLAVGLQVTGASIARAQSVPPPSAAPAPSAASPDDASESPLPARPRRTSQPEPAEPEPAGAEPDTASPPADVSPPAEQPIQTFQDEPDPEAPAGEQSTERTPEDIQSFADATMDARRLRFALNAFGDASLVGEKLEAADETASFSLGTLALLINGQLGASLVGTAEVSFNATADNDQSIVLERLQLRWQTPRYYVVGGRLHTDLGYWNTAFHHGAWLHLPISRPRVLRGEGGGGILPIHWIGLEGGFMVPVSPGLLTIAGGVGNGRGEVEGDIPLRTDSNDFKAVRLKLEYLGLGLPDLRVGVGGLYDRIAAEPATVRPELPDEEIDEIIANVYAAYRGVQLTLIAEAYAIRHSAGDRDFTTTDAFVVAGYRIGRVTPYVMGERTDARGGMDPFYSPEGMPTSSTPWDETRFSLGARIDTSVWSALKAEYAMLLPDNADGPDHTVIINWSFGI
jgi:hypothetical protein